MNLQALNLGASGTAARLRFEHIRHGYGGRDVVRDVSLTAFPGKVLCLLGPSGSGKSTLLRIAAGLEVPRGGRLLINDVEVAGPSAFLPPEQRGVGLMFQDFALFPHMTVAANVAFGLTHLSKPARRSAAPARACHGAARAACMRCTVRRTLTRSGWPAQGLTTAPPQAYADRGASAAARCGASCAGTGAASLALGCERNEH